MVMWCILALVCAAGAIGGIVNALLTDNGFPLPSKHLVEGHYIIQPGAIGNVLLGAIAAGVSFGLYGSLSNQALIGSSTGEPPILTVSALFGAVLVGVGGARLFTNEVDKQLFQAAAGQMATAAPDPSAAARIMRATPIQALQIASAMPSALSNPNVPESPDRGTTTTATANSSTE